MTLNIGDEVIATGNNERFNIDYTGKIIEIDEQYKLDNGLWYEERQLQIAPQQISTKLTDEEKDFIYDIIIEHNVSLDKIIARDKIVGTIGDYANEKILIRGILTKLFGEDYL